MRNLAIVAAAFLAVACEAPDGQRSDSAADNEALTGQNDAMMDGQDGMMAATPVSTGTYIAQAANSDMYEIQAGELAVKNGQSRQVKDFGRMMVEDHTKSSQDMKALVARGNFGTDVPTRLDSEHQAMLDRLKAAKGEAFDREYLSQQMTAHRKALALHQGYARGGENTELKGFAVQVVPVIQKHHDWLEQNGHGSMATGTAGGAMQPGNAGTAGENASTNRAPRATGTPGDQ